MKSFDYYTTRIGQNKILKKILNPFWHYLYVMPKERKIRNAMRENGIKLLLTFDQILSKGGVPYSLAFGTLLGAVREKGFIKHDLDIDVALWSDTDAKYVNKILEEGGFEKISEIVVDGGKAAREETYQYMGVNIDLFYFYPSKYDGLLSTCIFYPFKDCVTWKESINDHGGVLPLCVYLPMDKDVEYVQFESIKLPVTKSALRFVETRYGENWRIPDPTFVYPKPGYSKYDYLEGKIGVVTNY
jgi:hypothetical protein